MEKKLFLLDAYALIYRAYYALIKSPRYTSLGFNTSAIFGFCNTLDEVLRKENPSHIAVCFDPPGSTFRHEAFSEYKANREKQPEDISLSLPYIKDILAARGIPAIEVRGYEADDVIGTLSRKAEEEGFITYMMTPDKDYGQLVTDNILMYKPSLRGQDFEIRGVEQIKERYGIKSPLQVIDLLALEGDKVDNIPGCPGIGPKTANTLIQQFGSVENLIESIDSLKGAVKEKITQNSEQIIFSKFLATIKTDVPMDINLDTLIKGEEDVQQLISIYEKLEFRSLINRLNKQLKNENYTYSSQKSIDPIPATLWDVPAETDITYSDINIEPITIIDINNIKIDDIKQRLNTVKEVSVILKSIGENAMTANVLAVAIGLENKNVLYCKFSSPFDDDNKQRTLDILNYIFSQSTILVVSDDVKRMKVLLRNFNMNYKCNFFDVPIAHYLLNPEERHLIPEIAHQIIKYHTQEFQIEPRQRKPYDKIDSDTLERRLSELSWITRRLYQPLKEELEKANLLSLYENIELPLASVLAKMEMAGVKVDTLYLSQLSKQYTQQLNELQNQAYEIAGEKFNIGSPSQVGEILFVKLQIDPKAKKTKNGGFSTTEETLEKYKDSHPIVSLILKIRQLKKLLTTYIDQLPLMIDPITGKIHTTFNQTVTSTGRLSSTNPNLQNIPVRGDEGREIRRAFIADKGCIFMAADYNQIELRLMADFSKDPHMLNAFKNNLDIHQDTASRIFHKPLDQVTADDRRKAKVANFGIIYGISPFGLSERLGIPRGEAKEFIEDYMLTYPAIKEYIDNIIERAKADGYVETYTGRKRYIAEIQSRNATVRNYGERNAVNAPLQGSAADIIKKAMVDIQARMEKEKLRSEMIMQVHDELIFNIIPEELIVMQQLVSEEMSRAYNGEVKMTVSVGTGENWLEAH